MNPVQGGDVLKSGEPSPGHTNLVPPEVYLDDTIEFPVKPWFRSARFLRQKYLAEGLSSQQIARVVGSARSTVMRHLKAFGIPLRVQDEARRLNKAYPAYGERFRSGKLVPCKREQEVIAMVGNLRVQGMRLQAIADFLNASRIPTKTRKAKWKPATVWNLLNR
jgi:IS30 family transposase